MSKDEEYVISVWGNVETKHDVYKGCIFFTANALYMAVTAPTMPELWAKGAEFTRTRLEQVRQLREEIDSTKSSIKWFDQGGQYEDNRQSAIFARILTRLEAELATLTRDIRPEALEGVTR